MRDLKSIISFTEKSARKVKEMSLFKNLKRDVIAGANGTLDYVFKRGKNAGKTHKTKEK
jgi:hypothetical protein